MQPNPPNNEGYGQGYGQQYGQPYGQQQPEPQYGQPYGQPADHTSPDMYPQGDPGPAAQPSAVPYSGQASAPPYNPNMYNQQQPQPDYTQPFGAGGPPPPPRAKKKMSLLPLALMCGALVLVIGGVVAIVVLRESGSQERKTANANASAQKSKPLVEECMVGKWKQVEYSKDVPLDEAGVGTVRMKGPEDGTAIEITIKADGKQTEVWDGVVYQGESKSGQTVKVRFEGEFSYVVRTEGGKLIKNQPKGEATAYVDVDGTPKVKIPLRPTGDQVTYACEGDNAMSFSGDDDYYSKYERVKE